MSHLVQHVEVRSAYADSVALLQVSRTVAALPGVTAAQVAMATPLNLEVLTEMGFELPHAGPNDMVVALRLADPDPATLAAAVAGGDAALLALRTTRPARPHPRAPPPRPCARRTPATPCSSRCRARPPSSRPPTRSPPGTT